DAERYTSSQAGGGGRPALYALRGRRSLPDLGRVMSGDRHDLASRPCSVFCRRAAEGAYRVVTLGGDDPQPVRDFDVIVHAHGRVIALEQIFEWLAGGNGHGLIGVGPDHLSVRDAF